MSEIYWEQPLQGVLRAWPWASWQEEEKEEEKKRERK